MMSAPIPLQTRERPAQVNRHPVRLPPSGRSQPDRVLEVYRGEHPAPVIHEHRQILNVRLSQQFSTEGFRTLHAEGRPGKDDPDPPLSGRDEMPEAPAKRLIQIRVSHAHTREGTP